LDEIQTWEVLVARRPRLERHHAVAITDDALKAAIVLTDRFVPERARPDKAIDVLDEACAHAQATARVSPELDRLIRERRKLDEIQTWEVLVARRPRLERHHAVAITDDALKAAIVLTDRFVPERARPDKAIDVLDEACAHAQATARVSPELDRLIRERRKVD